MTEDTQNALGRHLAQITKAHVTLAIAEASRQFSVQVVGLQEQIKALEERLANVKDGAPGPQGAQGPPGERGAQGDQGPQGPAGTAGQAGDRGEKGITGEQGPIGLQGIAGRDGLPGVQGPHGEKGADGAHGKDGSDGKDGTVLDDFDVVTDEEGYQILRLMVGERVKDVYLHTPVDMGPYQAGRNYRKGASVSLRGCTWIAQKATSARPGDDPKEWRLAVKNGRDGKDGTKGDKGDPGKDGKNGRDLM